MSALTHLRTGHPEWCDGDHVPLPRGQHNSEPVEAAGKEWAVRLVMTDEGQTWVALSTEETLPAMAAAAMAAALIAAADRIDGVPFDHGVLLTPEDGSVALSSVFADTSDCMLLTGEEARTAAEQVLTLAGSGGWDVDYGGDPDAELYMRDLFAPLPRSGRRLQYGTCVTDGLRQSIIRRLERRVAGIAAALPRTTGWPTVLWMTDHGDAVVEALGAVPPEAVAGEFDSLEPGWVGCSVPHAAVAYLTAEQLGELRDRAAALFREAPRATPPVWAKGVPNEEGARCGRTTYVRSGHRWAPKSVALTPVWDPAEKPQVAVGVPEDEYPEGGRHWLQLTLPAARALAAEITRHADMIESEATR